MAQMCGAYECHTLSAMKPCAINLSTGPSRKVPVHNWEIGLGGYETAGRGLPVIASQAASWKSGTGALRSSARAGKMAPPSSLANAAGASSGIESQRALTR